MRMHYNDGIYTLTRKKEPQKDTVKIKLKKAEAKVLFSLYAHLGFDEITLEKYPFNA